VREQIRFLLSPAPVMLDPVLRSSRRARQDGTRWTLPQRAGSRTLWTFHGTAAVYQAVVALGLTDGEKVLIPSYNCGHEVEPILRAGAGVGFYRIDSQLRIDLDDLETAIDSRTRAVLVTHYFGFPQKLDAVKALCASRGLALIEDCAHTLFSADGAVPLGLAGDFAVYSLRKTLPLPHAGALVCHDTRWQLPRALDVPPRLSTWSKVLERRHKALLLPRGAVGFVTARAAFLGGRVALAASRALNRASGRLGALQWDPDDESLGFPNDVLSWGIAPSVEQALQSVEPAAIVAARRRNFAQLLHAADRFADCTALLPELPDGVCPLYFPVLAADPEGLLARLGRGAVSAAEWWGAFHPAVPWERFPEARRLKEQAVALPVHQDLEDVHMTRMIRLLEQA
jgi:perosamine synthetase